MTISGSVHATGHLRRYSGKQVMSLCGSIRPQNIALGRANKAIAKDIFPGLLTETRTIDAMMT